MSGVLSLVLPYGSAYAFYPSLIPSHLLISSIGWYLYSIILPYGTLPAPFILLGPIYELTTIATTLLPFN